MRSELTEAVIGLREQDALQIVDRLLEGGIDPLTIIESCREAMEVIGQRFSCGEAFIPELVMAGEIMKGMTDKVQPYLAAASPTKLGTVVICTVRGDIHDIGKDIVATMLGIAGFEVVDLGVDVPIARVVDTIREVRPAIIGLSGLLTIAFESMKATVAAIDEAALHDELRIMVGGAPVNEKVRAYVGADGWGKDAVVAVDLAKSWLGGAEDVR